MIFQDPYESMNPRLTLADTVAEPLAVQGIGRPTERMQRVVELFRMVGLTPPSRFMFRRPHELSGGQLQRAAIARAFSVRPSFIVADEPTSMLDVSMRASIIGLMNGFAEREGVSYLYITHDLGVARYVCDRVAVMYLGKVVEIGETERLLSSPSHPYTKALVSAVPDPDRTSPRLPPDIRGGVRRAVGPPDRCRFYDRCPIANDFCRDSPHPPLEEKSGRLVACYRV